MRQDDQARRDELDRIRDLLDFEDGRRPPEAAGIRLLDEAGVVELLRRARRIAIVGASANPIRPSNGVMRYLLDVGYDCVPVNPTVPEVLGRRSYPDLETATTATGTFDLVDVFRRWEELVPHAREAAASGAGAFWLQLGLVHWEAAAIAAASGLAVVMDRCTAIEVRRLRRSSVSG